jgi:hypothetical protein
MKRMIVAMIICLCDVAVAETTIKDVENVIKPTAPVVSAAARTPEVLTNGRGPQLSSTVMTISKEPKGSLVVVR